MTSLRLTAPCTERWSEMSPTTLGRHCAACDRTVLDLVRARATDALGLAYLHADGSRVCARVRVDADGFVQLRPDRAAPPSRRIAAPALAITAALSQTFACAGPTTDHVPATPTQIASTDSTPSSAPTESPQCERPQLVVPPPATPEEPKRVVVTSGGVSMPPPTIRFEANASAVRKEDREILAVIADTMRDHPEITLVDVVGHTDVTEDYGPQLAMQRANAVVAALVDLGIAADRLRAVSAASSLPLASNDTADGRAANRRISFTVVKR